MEKWFAPDSHTVAEDPIGDAAAVVAESAGEIDADAVAAAVRRQEDMGGLSLADRRRACHIAGTASSD